jgi:hypothetical protein
LADITQLAKRQRKELDAADEANLKRVAEAYAIMYDRLQGDVDALMLAISQLDAPTMVEIKRLPQYKNLIERAERELDRFETFLETTIGAAGLAAIGLGLAHSEALVNSLTGGGFAGVDSAAMKYLLEYLKDGSPLYERLALLTGGTVDRVIQAIVDGVGSGFNPRKIADLIRDAFGGGLTDALRWTRTTQLYSYRDSARANYMASGVVDKWMWYAELGDPATCESCIAMHGTLHDLDESLDDHFNGRCCALPYIEGLSEPIQSGEEWFNSLSEAEQRGIMGNNKYEAYKEGKFEFSQLSRQQVNDIFGSMRTVTPLKDLIGE